MKNNNNAPGARIRAVTTGTVIILALGSAVLSYHSLSLLAVQSGVPTQLAWLFPVIIDGLVLSGSMLVLYSAIYQTHAWFGWLLTLLGVGASTAGNVFIAPDNIAAQAVHAAPPIILALSLEGLMMLLRHTASIKAQGAAADPEIVTVDPVVMTPVVAEPVAPVPALAVEKAPSALAEAPVPAVEPVVAPTEPVVADTPSAARYDDLLGALPVSTPDLDAEGAESPLFASLRISDPAPALVSHEEPARVMVSAATSAPSRPATVTSVAKPAVSEPTVRGQVVALIEQNPSISVDEIAAIVEGDRKYVRKIARSELDKREALVG